MRSLRARFFVAIAGAVLATVAVTLVVAAWLAHRSLHDAALRDLRRQAHLLAQRELRPAPRPLGLFLQTQQSRLAILPRGQAALLLPQEAGRELVRGREAAGEVTVRGTRYLFAAQASGREAVVLLRSSDAVAADRRPLVLALVVSATAGAALAALAAWLLARGLARPLRRAAAASGAVAAGERAEPLPVRGSSEQRTLARSFNEMAERLQRARAAERAFLLSISHELKTPLTAIRGYAEAGEEQVLAPGRAFAVIRDEAARLERLVGDLLELARLNRQRFSVRCEPVELGEVARQAAARHTVRASELGVRLEWTAFAAAEAAADPDRIAQVVSNLVENSLRCTPRGGVVTIAAAPGEIAVVDTGPGIAPEDLPRTFERFFLYRRYGSERPVGTGLGLALVRDLTRAMGGEVEVESTLGAGTRFTVRLPRRRGGQNAAAAGRSPSTPRSQTSRNAAAASGSNCEPEQRSTSSSASSVVNAVR